MSKTVAVIGAGISGLCTSFWLHQNGYDVTVLEKLDRVGGSIISEKKDGFVIDLGPNTALETSETLKELIKDLGIEDKKIYGSYEANNRYIVRNGQLHPLAMSPLKFLKSKLFSTKAKIRLMREPFIKKIEAEDISLSDFVKYRLGQEFLDYAINPFVAGVYAGDPDNLSTPAGFPKLWALEQKYGSFIKGAVIGARERKKRKEVAKDRAKMFSFENGLQFFTDTMAEKVGGVQTGVDIQKLEKNGTGWNITYVQNGETQTKSFDNVVISTQTDSIAQFVNDLSSEASEAFKNIYYPPVTLIFMGFKKEQIGRPLDGFGFLVPKIENRKILGTLWSSVIFPDRAPEGHAALTTFVGGTRQPEMTDLSDEELEAVVLQELGDLMQISGKPVITRMLKWPRAIPQYTMGYMKIKAMFDELEQKNPGLYFATNARRGISVGDSVLCARDTFEKMTGTKA